MSRLGRIYAGIAQLVVQLICNQQVGGSSPSTSSNGKKLREQTQVSLFETLNFLEKKVLDL